MDLETKVQFMDRVRKSSQFKCLDRKPFDATDELVELTYNLVNNYGVGSMGRAVNIYKWIREKMWPYIDPRDLPGMTDLQKWNAGYRFKSASEAFSSRNGLCFDYSVLYTTMAKIAGFKSGIAYVSKTEVGKKIYHICSWISHAGDLILIDTSYGDYGIGIKHREYSIFDDSFAVEYYNEYCRTFNSGDFVVFPAVSGRYMELINARENGKVQFRQNSARQANTWQQNAGYNPRRVIRLDWDVSNRMLYLAFGGAIVTILLASNFGHIMNFYNSLVNRSFSFNLNSSLSKDAQDLEQEQKFGIVKAYGSAAKK